MQLTDITLRLCLRYMAMRNKQKEYFRTRGVFALKESRAMEAALDRDVNAYIVKSGYTDGKGQLEMTDAQ